MPLSHKHDDTKTYDDILNAGPPINQLAQDFVTPTELFFVRNHASIPDLDLDNYRLRVNGLVSEELSLSLSDIKNNFERHTLTATLQCAGNRRKEMVSYKPIDDGLAWGIEAIGTAQWSGVRLGDILKAAGICSDKAAHIAFLGLDGIMRDGARSPYGCSIPLEKALSCEVLLAYEMNGADLPLVHGCPLRVIVPGYVGAPQRQVALRNCRAGRAVAELLPAGRIQAVSAQHQCLQRQLCRWHATDQASGQFRHRATGRSQPLARRQDQR